MANDAAAPAPQKTDRFWCSAFVGYVYTACGILDGDTDWSILRPSDFSVQGAEHLRFISPAHLGALQGVSTL